MKKLLNLLLVWGCFTSCQCQNIKTLDFMKSLGNGYYSIPNKVRGNLILSDYQNYKNSNDSIFLEKILYLRKNDKYIFMIGNLMGSKDAIVLLLKSDNVKYKILFVDEVAFIDSLEKLKIKDYYFFLLNSHYSSTCYEEKGLSIYVLDNSKLYKCFEGIKRKKFYDTGDPLCLTGISYTQNFDLKLDNNKIVLNVDKKCLGKKRELKKYHYINHQFIK